ncbi:MAG: hypothetical protein ACLFTT_14910 [Candidatus Hydrogenedentota bacterium]
MKCISLMQTLGLAALTLSLVLGISACTQEDDTGSDFQEEASDATREAEDAATAGQDSWQHKMNERIEAIDEQMEAIEDRMEEAGDEAGDELAQRHQRLQDDRNELDRAWENLKQSSEEGWETGKDKVSSLVDTIDEELAQLQQDLGA